MAGTVTFGERIAPTRRAVVATLGRWAPVMTLAAVCGYALFVMAMRVAFISVGNDDGYYAYVSRNVAEGHGYVTSYGETAYTFNPGVSLGPAIILPGALLQAVFGSQYWVPNLVVPLIVLPVVVTIGWLLNRRFGVPVLGLAVLAAVSLAFTDERNYDGEIVRQLALWTHQMGDIPAVAFILLAAALVTMGDRRPATFGGAGALLGLAFYTRVASALALPGFALFLAWMVWRERDAWPLAALAAGVLAVASPFELYRLAELGSVSAYIDNTGDVIEFYRTWGFTGSDHDLESLLRQMSLSLGIFALIAWAGVLAFDWSRRGQLSEQEMRVAGLSVLLLVAGAVNLLWWVVLNDSGWYRHAIPGVMYLAVALTLLASHVRLRVTPYATAAVIAVLFATQGPVVADRDPPTSNEWRLEAQLATRDVMNDITDNNTSFWGCGWWGNRDLAYVGDFRFYDCTDAASVWKHLDAGERLVLVRSEFWNWENDPTLTAIQDDCDRHMIYEYVPFVVCDATEWLRENTPRPG